MRVSDPSGILVAVALLDMNLQLLATMPCKRFASEPMCKDGRGGGVFSQVGAYRSYASREECALFVGLSVLVDPSEEDDYVQATRLVASMDDTVIGDRTLVWIVPNKDGISCSQVKIYEWLQAIDLSPPGDGLVTVAVSVKLRSQNVFLPVNGHAYCYVSEKDTNSNQASVPRYFFKTLTSKTLTLPAAPSPPGSTASGERRLPWREVGRCYKTGNIPGEDQQPEAMECYQELAALGLPAAQAWCGEFYAMGQGRERDLDRGVRWIRAALDADDTRAKYLKAVLMALGKGGAQGFTRSVSSM